MPRVMSPTTSASNSAAGRELLSGEQNPRMDAGVSTRRAPTPDVRFGVSDGGANDSEAITITVNEAPDDGGGGGGDGGDSGTGGCQCPRNRQGKGPKRRKRGNDRDVQLLFERSRPSFECGLGRKEPKPCTSPIVAKRLKRGKHTFSVTAIDAAGNRDLTPAIWKFRVAR